MFRVFDALFAGFRVSFAFALSARNDKFYSMFCTCSRNWSMTTLSARPAAAIS
jgi:hypothetical protein